MTQDLCVHLLFLGFPLFDSLEELSHQYHQFHFHGFIFHVSTIWLIGGEHVLFFIGISKLTFWEMLLFPHLICMNTLIRKRKYISTYNFLV